jgi:RNA polymerase sigma-54 factor
MALIPRLELRQSQALVMTPQLMQAIKLLQLSTLDLIAYVDNELEQNPLLERADGRELIEEPAAAEPEQSASGGEEPQDFLGETMAGSREEIEQRLDTDLGNVFPDDAVAAPEPVAPPLEEGYSVSTWSQVGPGGSDGESGFESYVAAEKTLAEHLIDQLFLAVEDPAKRLIGVHLIHLIDDAGYLSDTVEAAAERLGAAAAEVEAVLRTIQTFDPPGIAARSLKECLAIQLEERDRLDPCMRALLDNLDLLAKRELPRLKRLCEVDEEDLLDMIAEIRRLTPKPGLAFGSSTVQTVVPDVLVRAAPDGSWHVELNAEVLPRLLVNQAYYARVAPRAANEAEKAFLTECLQTANWLTRSLEQRARTILKVASEIVRQQDGFLLYGVAHLRPLNLRMVADAIGIHESTVSRVTSNKYLATPRGIFEFKYFFTSAIANATGGEAHSAEAVRHRIRGMIEAEPVDEVLSDDVIVQRLRRDGIDIARRTVAKYREAMRIPSSVQRRREKLTTLPAASAPR